MGTLSRARRLIALALLLAVIGVGALPAAVVGANDTIASVDVTPLHYRGSAGTAQVSVALRRAARITVSVHRPNGRLIQTLAKGVRADRGRRTWQWNGRNGAGREQRNGQYRLRVTASNGQGTIVEQVRFRKGLPPIYPARPRAIVVAIDAGHGGSAWGAFFRGNYEKNYNLDIAFRLRRLLRQAGVTVVMTRTTDSMVNWPPVDVNGDGRITKADDLAARVDVANSVRADVFISIHNNSSACRCARGTEIYSSRLRPWASEGRALATSVHAEQLRALAAFRSRAYRPINRGVKSGAFYVMAPFDWPRRPRPSLMPTILTESLYVDNDIERALLDRAEVRQALATSFYVGIANYLNSRDYGVRYRLLREPPRTVTSGRSGRYVIRVTNTGNTRSRGWELQVRAVPMGRGYDGSPRAGRVIGSRVIRDGLAPGRSIDVRVNIEAPPPGSWLIVAGVTTGSSGRSHLSQTGVAELLANLRTRR